MLRYVDPSSDRFQMVVGLMIVLNALVIGLETDLVAYKKFWSILETGFVIFFLFEAVVRLIEDRVHVGKKPKS